MKQPEFSIRRASGDDHATLVDIWWRSAQATHHFIKPGELATLRNDVENLRLERLNTWLLCTVPTHPVGFLVMNYWEVAGLFIAPEWRRRGGGRRLMQHARTLAGPLTVQVNEQNYAALRFYVAQGFVVVSRSATDGAGRPYPLLQLAEGAGINTLPRESSHP